MAGREFEGRWYSFRAKGHQNITALHPTTIEITKDDYLTKRGDCIVGVSSEAGASDLPAWLKDRIRSGWLVVVVLCSGGFCDSIVGHGDPRLELTENRKIILRRSSYVEPSTVMLRGNKAAKDVRREVIKALSDGHMLDVYITAIPAPTREGA
ncbi:MAG: DUF371 domain-containing protein [Acidilobus sp.]